MGRSDQIRADSTELSRTQVSPNTTIQRVCPYCGGKQQRTLFNGREILSISDSKMLPYGLVLCVTCGTVFVNPAPSPDQLISLYPEDYYSPSIALASSAFKKFARAVSSLEVFTNSCLKEGRQTPGRAFELGCAAGDNLIPFVKAGWETIAFEPNPRLAELARSHGVKVECSFLSEKEKPSGTFDVIILNHVLEHTYDPRVVLRICHSLLSERGLLFLEVPLPGRLQLWLLGTYYGNLEFPIHLSLLPAARVKALVYETGFQIQSTRYSILFGTMRRTLAHLFPSGARTGALGRSAIGFAEAICQAWIALIESISASSDAVALVCSGE